MENKKFTLEEISKLNIPPQDMINMMYIRTSQNAVTLNVVLSTQARILSLLDKSTTEQYQLDVLHAAIETKLLKELESLILKY